MFLAYNEFLLLSKKEIHLIILKQFYHIFLPHASQLNFFKVKCINGQSLRKNAEFLQLNAQLSQINTKISRMNTNHSRINVSNLQNRENVTLSFASCKWYALHKRISNKRLIFYGIKRKQIIRSLVLNYFTVYFL